MVPLVALGILKDCIGHDFLKCRPDMSIIKPWIVKFIQIIRTLFLKHMGGFKNTRRSAACKCRMTIIVGLFSWLVVWLMACILIGLIFTNK